MTIAQESKTLKDSGSRCSKVMRSCKWPINCKDHIHIQSAVGILYDLPRNVSNQLTHTIQFSSRQFGFRSSKGHPFIVFAPV